MMVDFFIQSFDVALNIEPFTQAVCVFVGVTAVWRLTWYLVGGLNNG